MSGSVRSTTAFWIKAGAMSDLFDIDKISSCTLGEHLGMVSENDDARN